MSRDGRVYVPSTPASRGEPEPEVEATLDVEQALTELEAAKTRVGELEAALAAKDAELEAAKGDGDETAKQGGEGTATVEVTEPANPPQAPAARKQTPSRRK